jgi:hypothetical protein
MRGDATCHATDHGEASAGPDLAPEASGFGPTGQELGEAGQRLGGQSAVSTRRWPRAKGLGASFAGAPHPRADGPLGDAHRRGNFALGPAVWLELPGLYPSSCSPVVG